MDSSLTAEERAFLLAFTQSDFYLTHATDYDFKDRNNIVIHSKETMNDLNMARSVGTPSVDAMEFGSTNFAFFSLEVGDTPKKTGSILGANIYRLKYDNQVFADSVIQIVDPILLTAQGRGAGKISGLSDDAVQAINNKKHDLLDTLSIGRSESIDMMGYNIIEMSRMLPAKDKAVIINARTPEEINNILNGMFRPTVMVPGSANLKGLNVTTVGEKASQSAPVKPAAEKNTDR